MDTSRRGPGGAPHYLRFGSRCWTPMRPPSIAVYLRARRSSRMRHTSSVRRRPVSDLLVSHAHAQLQPPGEHGVELIALVAFVNEDRVPRERTHGPEGRQSVNIALVEVGIGHSITGRTRDRPSTISAQPRTDAPRPAPGTSGRACGRCPRMRRRALCDSEAARRMAR